MTREDVERMMDYIAHNGALHEYPECPEDDTCDCKFRETNASVTVCCKFLHDAPSRISALEAQVKALTAERDAQVWIAKLAYAERDVARGLHAEACKERDAQAEAVRVLGEECRVYRMHVGLCNAVDSRGRIVLSRLQRGTVASNLWDDAVRAVRNNHIARAAVEGKETQ